MPNKLDEDYIKLLKDILNNGNNRGDRTGTGTKSVFSREFKHSMSTGFPVITSKKMSFKGIVIECLWFLRGGVMLKPLLENGSHIWVGDAYKSYCNSFKYDDEAQKFASMATFDDTPDTREMFIEKILHNEEYSKKWGDLGKIYGYQWRNWNGEIDQISNLINDLKNNPDSRRLMVTAWNPSDLNSVILPACHHGFQCYTRELSIKERIAMANIFCPYQLPDQYEDWNDEILNRNNIPQRSISLKFLQRSADFPLGIPFNITSYGLLLTILGKMSNMFPEELIGSFGDCHIYNNQIDGVKEQIERTSFDLPKLIIADHVDFSQGIDEMLASCTPNDFKLDGYQSIQQ